MRTNHILRVQKELNHTRKLENSAQKDLKSLNTKQLQEKEYEKMIESIPSRNRIIKRKIVLKNRNPSKNFIHWLFSNKEK